MLVLPREIKQMFMNFKWLLINEPQMCGVFEFLGVCFPCFPFQEGQWKNGIRFADESLLPSLNATSFLGWVLGFELGVLCLVLSVFHSCGSGSR